MSCTTRQNQVMENEKMLICEARIKVSRDGNMSWTNRNVEYQTARMVYDKYDPNFIRSKIDKEMFFNIAMKDIKTLIEQTSWKWMIVKMHVFDGDYNYLCGKSVPNCQILN